MPRKSRNYRIIKQIAKTRMEFLFKKAHEIFPTQKELANKYVYFARKYAQRAKLKIPLTWKRRICHSCKQLLYPGINCRIRLHSHGKASHISMTCLECENTTRYYIKTKII